MSFMDGYWTGSAAVAIDPSRPHIVYYVPRTDTTTSATYSGLREYNTLTRTQRQVTTEVVRTVRLGTAPDGSVWSIDTTGALRKWTPATGRWETYSLTTSDGRSFLSGYLGSGDLAFDGLGNMWIIGSTNQQAYLYTISKADLERAGTRVAHPCRTHGRRRVQRHRLQQ